MNKKEQFFPKSDYPTSTKAEIKKQLEEDGFTNVRFSGKEIVLPNGKDENGKLKEKTRQHGFYATKK